MVYRRADAVQKEQNGEAMEGVDGSTASRGKVEQSSLGEGAQCIWLARVRPEDCEGIIKYTVLQGKVVKPERQLRGGFDRAKGLVSW
jgi:(2Fe-2S) ferredoxin